MPGRKKKGPQEEPRAAADYYKLKTAAIDDLVTADESNSPPVSQRELNRYRSGLKLNLADKVKATLKACLLKAWMGGVVCYFFLWGLGLSVSSQLDLIVISGAAMGFIHNMITNNILRFIEKTPGANDRYMMFPGKSAWWIPADVVYGLVIMALTVATYALLNLALIALSGAEPGTTMLGVEPLLFGLITMGWDMALIALKHGIQRLTNRGGAGPDTPEK